MSGSTGVIVASTLPMAVLCTNEAEPGQHATYSVSIAGERDFDGVHGTGITEGVDQAAFDYWIGVNPDLAEHVKVISEAELADLQNAEENYGFQAGLEAAKEAPADPRWQAIEKAQAAVNEAASKLAADQRSVALAAAKLHSAMVAPAARAS